jgi:uncharacterized membrane protein
MRMANRTRTPKTRIGLMVDYLETHEGTSRLEAFSDGIFSIAATLLVLDIRVPRSEPGAAHLLAALINLWPVYIHYAMSFLYIGIYWANHHCIFKRFRRTDHLFVMLNMLFLMLIALIPFPTALLAEYLRTPGDEQRIALLVYSEVLALTALLFLSIWLYATYRHRLVDPNLDARMIRAVTRQYQFGPLIYTVSFIMAFWSRALTLAIYLNAAVFYFLPVRVIWRVTGETPKETE